MAATGHVVTSGGGGSGAWEDITGKPATFPPDAHTHPWADIEDAPATYPPDSHTHAYADITGKPSEFTPAAHVHSIADVTALQAVLDALAAAGGGGVSLPDNIVPVPGMWYALPYGRVASNVSPALGSMRMIPLPVGKNPVTLTDLSVEVASASAGSSGGVARAVLWSADSVRNPVVSFRDLGTVSTETTGAKQWNSIAQALDLDTLYWVGIAPQVATCAFRGVSSYNAYGYSATPLTGTGEISGLAMAGLTGPVADGTAFVLSGGDNVPRVSARFA